MSKKLVFEFIEFSDRPKHVREYLRHMSDLNWITLEDSTTYEQLFNSVKEAFKDNVDKLTAAIDWIDFNLENTDLPLQEKVDGADKYAMVNFYIPKNI